MAMEQYFQEAVARNDFSREHVASSPEKWKTALAVDGSDNCQSGGFDCNICFDFVQDPVVTLCGHLYCWPCIYKWIHFQSASTEYAEQQQPQCPVCKAEVSQKTLVPLYGRGKTTKPSEGKAPHLGIVVPQRPPSPTCSVRTLITTTTTATSQAAQQLNHRSYPQQSQPYYSHPGSYASTPVLSLGGTTATNVFSPMIGMFGEMVFARIFGNSEAPLYAYPNSYNLTGTSSPRMRRQAMQEKSPSAEFVSSYAVAWYCAFSCSE